MRCKLYIFFFVRDALYSTVGLKFDFQDRPGKFLLSYLPRNHFRHEYVTVTPEGYRFRGQVFETLGGLLKWFKEHFRDPIPGTPGANTPHSVMNPQTPMMSTFMNHLYKYVELFH